MRKKFKILFSIIKILLHINWFKTIRLNFRMFPFSVAKKLPVVIFGKCAFKNLEGKIILEGPVTFGKITIGQRYQMFTKEKGVSELHIFGELRCKGRAQFGLDCKVYIGKNAFCTFGDMTSIGNDTALICTKKITFGEFCQTGQETFITDSNFHNMKDVISGEVFPKSFEISIGNYNFIGTRVTLMGKTKTPDYATIASCSLTNKDYTDLGENVILGGIPAKVVKNNVTRDWESEKTALERYMKIL